MFEVLASTQAFLVILLLLISERGFELWLSRRHAKILLSRGGHEVGATHFRFMSLLHSLFFVSCAAEVIFLRRPFPVPYGYVALTLALLAQALRYWAIVSLGDRWNVRVIVDPSRAPIVAGPYRYLRHPNYLAVIVEIVAVPLIHGAYLTAIVFSLLNAIVLSVRIASEERALGSAYQQAFGAHARFVPRRAEK